VANSMQALLADSEQTPLPLRSGRKISLTALIDVVFILLMFFMLTSTFSHWQSLPLSSASGSVSSSSPDPAVILLYPDGSVRLLTEDVSPVINDLSSIKVIAQSRPIVVSSEESTTLAVMINVMQKLKNVGINAPLGQPFSAPETSLTGSN